MTPETFRRNMRDLIERWFRIDQWSLNKPESRLDIDHPPSVARESPLTTVTKLTNVTNRSTNPSFQVEQKASYQVLYRLPGSYTYDQVLHEYRGAFETQLLALAGKLQNDPGCIECTSAKVSIKVSAPQVEKKDYILSGQLEGTFTYESSPLSASFSPLFTPTPLQ